MIVFDLECRSGGHRFEGWFGSSEEFGRQQQGGLLCCPQCGDADVIKAPMAPSVGRKGNQLASPAAAPAQVMAPGPQLPAEAAKVLRAMASLQAEMLKDSSWVGDKFVEQSRAMHYGESEVVTIHGEATAEEARELLEEGISVAPLLFPVAPPGKAN